MGMEAVAGERVEQGCYDLRGPDYETLMVGAVTPTIVDAARLVRLDWRNGFPNWAMYRTAYAGDSHLSQNLRAWCEAFGMALVEAGEHGKPAVGLYAGRDAFICLTTLRWGAPADELAKALGVAPKTYRRVRKEILARLMVSLREYWVRLGIAMRQVALLERKAESAEPVVRLSEGRGFGHDLDVVDDGNFRARPRGSGC